MPGLVSLQTPPSTPPLQILLPNGSDDRPESRSAKSRNPTPRKTPSPSPSSSRPRKKTPPHPDDPAGDDSSLDNPDLGPFLLKQARDAIASGDSPAKALDLAIRASRSFERCASDGEPSLELSMSLHVVAAIYCSLGRFDDAVPVLEWVVGYRRWSKGR